MAAERAPTLCKVLVVTPLEPKDDVAAYASFLSIMTIVTCFVPRLEIGCLAASKCLSVLVPLKEAVS